MPDYLGFTLYAFMYLKMQPPTDLSILCYIGKARDLKVKVPNIVAQSQIDILSVPSSPAPGGMRKYAKCVTFQDPL